MFSTATWEAAMKYEVNCILSITRYFVVNRFFMKPFNTNVIDTVKLCQDYFDFDLPCVMTEK